MKKSTKRIGKTAWSMDDLRVETFRNGAPICRAQDEREWERYYRQGIPAFCHSDYKGAEGSYCYYNVFALLDRNGLAPRGYALPRRHEFEELFRYLNDHPARVDSLSSARQRILQEIHAEVRVQEKRFPRFRERNEVKELSGNMYLSTSPSRMASMEFIRLSERGWEVIRDFDKWMRGGLPEETELKRVFDDQLYAVRLPMDDDYRALLMERLPILFDAHEAGDGRFNLPYSVITLAGPSHPGVLFSLHQFPKFKVRLIEAD